jgi:hypothetical protein
VERADEVDSRITALQREVMEAEEKLKLLYKMVDDDGLTEMDEILTVSPH